MPFISLYLAIGFGVVLALSVAAWDKLKDYPWKQLLLGHTLAFFLWPIAVWNNKNIVPRKKK